MRYFFLYVTCIVCILGCSFSQKTPDHIHIDIGENSFIDTLLFDRKEIIFLETRDDNLLTNNIERITLFEDKILLQDLAAHQVYVFKRDGSFLFPVGKTGRGPGEYIQLTDYCVNTHTKEIILYSNIPNKFIFYSLDEGKFLREIETQEYFHDISCTTESILGVNFHFHEPQHYISQLDFRDSLSKIRKHRLEHWDIGGIFVGGKQITRSKEINFSRRYDNTIYSFQNNRIIPRFHLDFGERNLPEHIGKLKISTEEFRKISDNKVFSIVNLKETPDCMYFSTLYPGFCFFSKKTLSGGHYYRMAAEDWGVITMHPVVSVEDPTNRYIGIIRDVNSLKTDVLLFQKIGRRLIKDLTEEITFSPPQTETFQKQVENLADDANPALILLHSKR